MLMILCASNSQYHSLKISLFTIPISNSSTYEGVWILISSILRFEQGFLLGSHNLESPTLEILKPSRENQQSTTSYIATCCLEMGQPISTEEEQPIGDEQAARFIVELMQYVSYLLSGRTTEYVANSSSAQRSYIGSRNSY
jgi:hypothetical protein